MSKLHCQDYCDDCIDRQIVTALRIKGVLTDPVNCDMERRRVIDLLVKRDRLAEKALKTKGKVV